MQVSADVPLHLLPSQPEWRSLMAKTTVPETAQCIRGVPCRVWRGGAQMRYHGKRWIPRRLFYILGVDGGHIRMKKCKIITVCGRPDCIESMHLQAAPHEPPSQRDYAGKRLHLSSDEDNDDSARLSSSSGLSLFSPPPKRVHSESAVDTDALKELIKKTFGTDDIYDDDDDVVDEEADAQVEEIMRELYEELARIDAEEREMHKKDDDDNTLNRPFTVNNVPIDFSQFLL